MSESGELLNLSVLLSAFEGALERPQLEWRNIEGYGRVVDDAALGDLPAYKRLTDYLSEKASARKHLRHYGTYERINDIVTQRKLYLSDGARWNDVWDRNRFNNPQLSEKRFGTCLSATTEESIAMWMLYSGSDRNGAMIDFQPSTLKAAMGRAWYRCGYFDKGQFVEIAKIPSNEINLRLSDVLYYSFNGAVPGNVWLRRKAAREKRYSANAKTLLNLRDIVKNEAWSYEIEVRLIASISRDLLKIYEDQYERTHKKRFTISSIELCLDDIDLSRVYVSPVIKGIASGFSPSLLTGEVDWDLCNGCGYLQMSGICTS